MLSSEIRTERLPGCLRHVSLIRLLVDDAECKVKVNGKEQHNKTTYIQVHKNVHDFNNR
jgi:hypothetical protein